MCEVEKKTKILETCKELIQTRGYNSFTINEIANLLQISQSNIHYHFRTKEDLVKETVIKYKNDFSQMLDKIEQQEESLRKCLEGLINLYASVLEPDNTKICLCMTLIVEINVLPQSIIEELNQFFDLQCDWIIKIFQEYETTPLLNYESAMLVSGLEGMIAVARMKGGSRYFKEMSSSLIDNFLVLRQK